MVYVYTTGKWFDPTPYRTPYTLQATAYSLPQYYLLFFVICNAKAPSVGNLGDLHGLLPSSQTIPALPTASNARSKEKKTFYSVSWIKRQ